MVIIPGERYRARPNSFDLPENGESIPFVTVLGSRSDIGGFDGTNNQQSQKKISISRLAVQLSLFPVAVLSKWHVVMV